MGLFSLIGGLLGGHAQKKAIEQATQQQLAYQQKALDQQQAQFGVTQHNIAPWVQEGGKAIGAQGDLTGINGNPAQQTAIDGVLKGPYYESLYRNGLEANLQNASATGGIRGGNEVRSLADFGTDTLAKSIQQQLENLGGISGMGANTALGLGSISQNNSDSQSSIFGAQGATRANGTMRKGAITAGMWGQAGVFGDQVAAAIAGGMPGGGMMNMGGMAGTGFNLGQLFSAAPPQQNRGY